MNCTGVAQSGRARKFLFSFVPLTMVKKRVTSIWDSEVVGSNPAPCVKIYVGSSSVGRARALDSLFVCSSMMVKERVTSHGSSRSQVQFLSACPELKEMDSENNRYFKLGMKKLLLIILLFLSFRSRRPYV